MGLEKHLLLVATEEDLLEIKSRAKKGDKLAKMLLGGILDDEQEQCDPDD